MSNIGRTQGNLNAAALANFNAASAFNENPGTFDGRTVRQLEEAGNSTPTPTSNVTTLFRTASNAEINQLKEIASQARTSANFGALAAQLKGLEPEQLSQVLMAQGKHGRTPMHWAAKDTASLQALKQLLDTLDPTQTVDLLKAKDQHGNTPMHWAARDAETMQSAAEQDVSDELNTLEASRWNVARRNAARRDAAMRGARDELSTHIALSQQNLSSHQNLRAVIAIANPTSLKDLEPLLNKLNPAQIAELLQVTGQNGDTLLHIVAKQGNAEEICLLREWLMPS